MKNIDRRESLRQELTDPPKEGKIDYFDKFRSFGVILQRDDTRIFFHNSRTTYPVREGDLVNYQVENGPSGWHAVNITKMPR